MAYALTGGLAFFFSVLAFALPPVGALMAFTCALFTYPTRMTLPIGTADFTLGRFVIIPLLLNAILRQKRLRNFKPNAMDAVVVILWGGCTLAALMTMPTATVLERQGGIFFDNVMPYFAVRLLITSKAEFLKYVKYLAILGVPLALIGITESLTMKNPYHLLRPFYGMGFSTEAIEAALREGVNEKRMGLYRASGSFDIHISWGLFFAALWPICLGLLHQKVVSRERVLLLTAILIVGLISSASSAPLFALITACLMIVAYPYRRAWPVLVVSVLLMLIFVEVYSNRHFYHVLTRLALNKETAYYRIGLFEQTFGGGMDGHWVFGYGYVGVGPGTDNSNFPFLYRDLVNIYIFYLVRYGLVGLAPFIALNVLYYRRLVQAAVIARTYADKWTIWCFGTALVSWNVAMMTVGALAQTEIFFAMLLGIACNLPVIMAAESVQSVPAHEPVRGTAPISATALVRSRHYRSGPSAPRPPWKSKFRQRIEAGGALKRRHV
jgi:hypothetical protein